MGLDADESMVLQISANLVAALQLLQIFVITRASSPTDSLSTKIIKIRTAEIARKIWRVGAI